MANQDRSNDAADERQNQPRRGLEGKGFDAGTGYGGAGSDSAYSGESSYGGQSGIGGSTTRGAYAGEAYGREGDEDAGRSGKQSGGQSGRSGSAPDGAEIPRGTDEHSESGERSGGGRDVDPKGVDLDGPLGGERRDPGR